SNLGEKRIITKDTIPMPTNFYGNSKLQAEQGILPLQDETFSVVVLRPPMIYGPGSKGNYPKLAKLARKMPIFLDIDNERSMLFIDNLCEFIRLMIEHNEKGVFFPQNKETVKTSELVKQIAEVYGKKIFLIKGLNLVVRLCSTSIPLINKVFGSLVYKKELSLYQGFEYNICNMKETIRKTEESKLL
ncbi:MAG: NAD-dependent epimerase/dehydratase family protein, partial [Eubacterium sp.]